VVRVCASCGESGHFTHLYVLRKLCGPVWAARSVCVQRAVGSAHLAFFTARATVHGSLSIGEGLGCLRSDGGRSDRSNHRGALPRADTNHPHHIDSTVAVDEEDVELIIGLTGRRDLAVR
jgi:hypothetical protein